MTVRKFVRSELEREPHDVLFKDLYPWDAIEETPFGASYAIVEPGGRTMLHSHRPAESFVICRGAGTLTIDQQVTALGPGDVVYMRPNCLHDLRNDSASEELVFVSLFWTPQAVTAGAARPVLLVPSPPTSNGPLHLGHLSGPYLLADVLRRYHRLRGVPVATLCLFDENQTYVADRGLVDGISAEAAAERYSQRALADFTAFDAAPDAAVFSSRDAEYREAVRRNFDALVANGALQRRERDALYCERCAIILYDGYVYGRCPHCNAAAFGFICESCCMPNDAAALVDPICDRCKQVPVRRTIQRYELDPAPHVERIADYHRRTRLAPKLRVLAAQFLARRDPIIATQPGTWGIHAGDDQIISPWFEIALAAPYLRERYAPAAGADVVHCFGYDNAYLYLVHDPAVALALDASATLPAELAANEFLLLGDAKMSTSQGHAVDAADALAGVPADLLRLYLAKVRPEDVRTSASLPAAQMYLSVIAQYWQSWLARVGGYVAHEAGGRAPAAANLSLQPWSPEQNQFRAHLESVVGRARAGYDDLSLKEVMLALHELVDRGSAFGASQAHLATLPELATQRATGLALELAALRSFALVAAPVMPELAARLWRALGYTQPPAWTADVEPLPPGQPIATETLQSFAFFPAAIGLSG